MRIVPAFLPTVMVSRRCSCRGEALMSATMASTLTVISRHYVGGKRENYGAESRSELQTSM